MKNYVKNLQDKEITRIYREKIKKGITEYSEQQNNQNEETSQTKRENIKKVVTTVHMKKGRRGMIV